MATIAHDREPVVARVDRLVDENGYKVDVPEDTALKIATDVEQVTGATGPTSWWRMGLVGLGIVAAILLALADNDQTFCGLRLFFCRSGLRIGSHGPQAKRNSDRQCGLESGLLHHRNFTPHL